jgi:hypothetical protein
MNTHSLSGHLNFKSNPGKEGIEKSLTWNYQYGISSCFYAKSDEFGMDDC